MVPLYSTDPLSVKIQRLLARHNAGKPSLSLKPVKATKHYFQLEAGRGHRHISVRRGPPFLPSLYKGWPILRMWRSDIKNRPIH